MAVKGWNSNDWTAREFPAFVFFDSPQISQRWAEEGLSLILQMKKLRSKERETNITDDTELVNGQDVNMDFMIPSWPDGWVYRSSQELLKEWRARISS